MAFLRTQIDRIDTYFEPGEVEAIWITFPDPQLRMSKAKKRLTHPKFLRLYKRFLTPEGTIHLKTDSPVLYQFTRLVIELYGLDLLKSYDDLYADDGISEDLKIKTYYEGLDIAGSRKVYYLSFRLNGKLDLEKDEMLKQKLRETEVG